MIAAMLTPNPKAQITRLEIAFLQMLEIAFGIELVVPWQVHLAVFADDLGVLVDQDLGVEVMAVRRQFGKPP